MPSKGFEKPNGETMGIGGDSLVMGGQNDSLVSREESHDIDNSIFVGYVEVSSTFDPNRYSCRFKNRFCLRIL